MMDKKKSHKYLHREEKTPIEAPVPAGARHFGNTLLSRTRRPDTLLMICKNILKISI